MRTSTPGLLKFPTGPFRLPQQGKKVIIVSRGYCPIPHGTDVAQYLEWFLIGIEWVKQILRCALQKLDVLLVSIEQLGPSLSEPSSPRN
jgi:hypothetical protein